MQEVFKKITHRLVDQLESKVQPYMPPLELIINSGSIDIPHYIDNLRVYTKDFIEQCMLMRNQRVLEIGCGCGRIANGLIHYLSVEGEYVGIDVDRQIIDWCERNISTRNSNFEFYQVDVANNYYYQDDNQQTNTYDFSFLESREFDCVIALSVFNHLRLEDTQQYLQEISKRLAINGLAYCTFWIIDNDFLEFQEGSKKHLALKRQDNGIWYGYQRQSFFAGYESELLNNIFAEANLKVIDFCPGSWARKKNARLYQDWYLLERKIDTVY